MIKIEFYGIPALWYAIASLIRFPNPPINGFLNSGNNFLIFYNRLVFTITDYLNAYFLAAVSSYSGSVINGPFIFVCFSIYDLEKLYNDIGLIVNHTILIYFLSNASIS